MKKALLLFAIPLLVCCGRHDSSRIDGADLVALHKMEDVVGMYKELTSDDGNKRLFGDMKEPARSTAYRAYMKSFYLKGKSISVEALNRAVPFTGFEPPPPGTTAPDPKSVRKGLGDAFSKDFLEGIRLQIGKNADDPQKPSTDVKDEKGVADMAEGIQKVMAFFSYCGAASTVIIKNVNDEDEMNLAHQMTNHKGGEKLQ